MNKRTKFALFGAGAFVAIAFSVLFLLARSPSLTSSTPASFQVSRAPQIVAGPGRVEPASEDIKIGSEISGKLKFVHLQEGDAVTVGQVIAELENDDYRAAVSRAEAQVAVQRASLKKLLVGARPQERQEAKASVQEADAVVRNSQAELERRKRLHAERVVSQEELQIFVRQNAVAQARLEKARARRALIEAPPRQEDRAIAEAELARAQAMLQETRARLAKTQIRSPIDGTVLRKHHRSGESVSNSATVPDPILTVGDQRRLNVRVEVDESDVGRVWVGQEAKITADALAGRSLLGHVIRVGQQLGRKKIHTDEPAERVDNKFLEVLIELEPGAVLPIGLRVAALITVGERSYLETSTSQLEMPLR